MKKIDSLLPSFKPKVMVLLHELELQGITCVVTSARRTLAEQNKIYQQGRTTPGAIVSNARGGESAHNFGSAVDICPLNSAGELWWDCPDDIWHVIALTATKNGLEAGYDWAKFRDAPHVQDPHWKDQQALWKQGRIQVA